MEYKYLGRVLTPGNEMARQIDESITLAWKRFGQFSTFFRDQRIPMCMKKKIMDSLLSLKEVWREQHWESQRDKIRNEDLRMRTKVKDVIQKAFEAKGKWAGHITQMKNHEWVQKMTE